jgi:hypothetical protein
MMLLAIVAVFPRMTQHRKNITESDQARMIGTEVLERVQTIDCATPLTSALTPVLPNVLVSREIGAVVYKVNESDVSRNCSGDIKIATVTVRWKKGKDHSVSVTGVVR